MLLLLTIPKMLQGILFICFLIGVSVIATVTTQTEIIEVPNMRTQQIILQYIKQLKAERLRVQQLGKLQKNVELQSAYTDRSLDLAATIEEFEKLIGRLADNNCVQLAPNPPLQIILQNVDSKVFIHNRLKELSWQRLENDKELLEDKVNIQKIDIRKDELEKLLTQLSNFKNQ